MSETDQRTPQERLIARLLSYVRQAQRVLDRGQLAGVADIDRLQVLATGREVLAHARGERKQYGE
jgi:hypothetical protein